MLAPGAVWLCDLVPVCPRPSFPALIWFLSSFLLLWAWRPGSSLVSDDDRSATPQLSPAETSEWSSLGSEACFLRF